MAGKNEKERHELEGRYHKAWELARYLSSAGIDHVTAAGWDADQWNAAAGMAGVKPPSDKTQGMVIGMLTPGIGS